MPCTSSGVVGLTVLGRLGERRGLTSRISEVVIMTTECGRVRIRRRTLVDSDDSARELKSSSEGEAEVWGAERGSISGFGTLCSVVFFPDDFREDDVWSDRWASAWSVRIDIISNWSCEPLLEA